MFHAASASADGRIGKQGEGVGALYGPEGLAVSQTEGGDVYVADSTNQRIDQFEPDGTFVRAFGWGIINGAPELQTCTTATGCQRNFDGNFEPVVGSEPGQLNYPDEIAVDNSCAGHLPPLTESTTPKCSEFDPSYGDIYVVDQRNYRVEKYSPTGEFLLMFGGEVDKTTGANVCTVEDVEVKHDTCSAGVPGTGPSHFYEENPPTGGGGSFANKTWSTEENNSIAVGPDGTVYVGDYGRIQEFDATGTFIGEFTLPDTEPQFVGSLALDPAGNIYERSATNYRDGSPLTQVPGVREFSPAHTLLQTFDAQSGSEPTHVALNEAGDLFVSDRSGREVEFREFKPDGTLIAAFTSDQVTTVCSECRAVAKGLAAGATQLFATSPAPEGDHIAVIPQPQPGPPTISDEHVTDVEPQTATLRAIVNPEQFGTHYRFQFIDEAHFRNGGYSNPATESTALTDLGAVSHDDAVQAAISGLNPATTYHFRVVAENTFNGHSETSGADETFETLPPVSVRDFTTQTVGPELVTIKFELNPNGQSSTYQIKYGTTTAYNAGEATGTLSVGNSFAQKEVTFTNLQPNTEYHYRLIAENGYGTSESDDQVFITELSSAQERQVEDCPLNGTVHGDASSTLREENNSTALPDCRAYEQVSPPDKNGYGVSIAGGISFAGSSPNELAPSGERALFHSTGAFAGTTALGSFLADYIAHRTPSGWVTEPVLSFLAGPDYFSVLWTFSAELDSWLQLMQFAPSAGAPRHEPSETTFYLHNPDGSNTLATPPLFPAEGVSQEGYSIEPVAQSADLSRIFIGANYPLLASDPRPYEGYGGMDRIYEVSGAGGPSPTLSLAAEVPTQLHGCALDNNFTRSENWASADGTTLLYTQPCETDSLPAGLFARIDGGAPIELSTESPGQCASSSPCHNAPPATASYAGVSPDGARVWFTTSQPLIDSDTDTTTDVYLANLENGQLKDLVQASSGEATASHPTPGKGAGVLDVLKVSPDGSHAAFVAGGVLTEEENGLHQSAESGARNLYVYDADSNETKFVTELCSGPEESGSVKDPSCSPSLEPEIFPGLADDDQLLWVGNRPPVQMTPDGRFLLFNSWGRLAGGDTDSVVDVYRYDFSTGQLNRVSIGHRGNDGNGNDDEFPAEIPKNWGRGGTVLDGAEDPIRSISADGSTVIFRTAAPLVSFDTNGGKEASCELRDSGCDVYEWEQTGHEGCTEPSGCISLVSDGVTPQGARAGVVSSSGRDITFVTTAGLVPADKDGVPDIYDARTNGGFPYVPPGTRCQTPESCRGAGSEQTLNPNYTTESFVGPGNEPTQLKCAKGKHRVRKHGQVRCVGNRHHHRRHRTRHRNPHSRAANNNSGGRR